MTTALEDLEYPHRCVVTRRTAGATDAVGLPTFTSTPVASAQMCRFDDAGTRELAGRLVATIARAKLYLPITADILENDTVSNISRAGTVYWAGPYEVISIRDPGGEGDHLEVELERIK